MRTASQTSQELEALGFMISAKLAESFQYKATRTGALVAHGYIERVKTSDTKEALYRLTDTGVRLVLNGMTVDEIISNHIVSKEEIPHLIEVGVLSSFTVNDTEYFTIPNDGSVIVRNSLRKYESRTNLVLIDPVRVERARINGYLTPVELRDLFGVTNKNVRRLVQKGFLDTFFFQNEDNTLVRTLLRFREAGMICYGWLPAHLLRSLFEFTDLNSLPSVPTPYVKGGVLYSTANLTPVSASTASTESAVMASTIEAIETTTVTPTTTITMTDLMTPTVDDEITSLEGIYTLGRRDNALSLTEQRILKMKIHALKYGNPFEGTTPTAPTATATTTDTPTIEARNPEHQRLMVSLQEANELARKDGNLWDQKFTISLMMRLVKGDSLTTRQFRVLQSRCNKYGVPIT